MATRRPVAVAAAVEPVLPDWVLECIVEDWVDVGRHAFIGADCRLHDRADDENPDVSSSMPCSVWTVSLTAWRRWTRERRRWADDHGHTETLPTRRPRWEHFPAGCSLEHHNR